MGELYWKVVRGLSELIIIIYKEVIFLITGKKK